MSRNFQNGVQNFLNGQVRPRIHECEMKLNVIARQCGRTFTRSDSIDVIARCDQALNKLNIIYNILVSINNINNARTVLSQLIDTHLTRIQTCGGNNIELLKLKLILISYTSSSYRPRTSCQQSTCQMPRQQRKY